MPSASPPPSAPIPARRWTRRRRCCAPWRPSSKQALRILRAVRQHDADTGHHHRRRRSRSTSSSTERHVRASARTSCSCGRTLFGARRPRARSWKTTTSASSSPAVAAYHEGARRRAVEAGHPREDRSTTRWPRPSTSWRPSTPTTNLAVDHNQLTMETMQQVASRHGLVCLLHEKPFDGVNGSGKHNNWSMATDTGGATCSTRARTPWKTCSSCCSSPAVIEAVDEYQELLRMSAATRGQRPSSGRQRGAAGHRLHVPGRRAGRHCWSAHRRRRALQRLGRARSMDLGVDVLPNVHQGQHRPQPHLPLRLHRQQVRVPHARAAPMNLSDANMVLNTAVAKSLKDFADADGRHDRRGVRGGRHRLHQAHPARPRAHHLQRRRLLRGVGARGRSAAAWRTIAPRPTRCRAWSTRSPSTCSRSSACSPRPRCAPATR